MKYQVLLSKTSYNYLKKLPEKEKKKIKEGLKELENDPSKTRAKVDIKKLINTKPQKYRLRIGNYRSVFVIEEKTVKIIEIFMRSKGYKMA
jgi:mRNA interferase RelE/StbE